MSSDYRYMLSLDDLSDTADIIKVAIILSLVDDKLLDAKDAEWWAHNHTVLARKKGFFRTLTDIWKNTEEEKGILFKVVKLC